jgi:ABC-2 type transport system ATP-binding protein
VDAIRCEGLTKRYASTVAVDRLDLAVGAGAVFGFLGPNGSGKTTTMRMLLGLIRPTAGRGWLNGRPLPDPAGLSRIGAMIEEPAFHPWLSGRCNLEVLALCGPRLAGANAIDRAVERVGLSGVASRRVKTYSQGMRQRLGLAVALMRSPTLLMLDEPTNGMDPAGIHEFRALLRSLAEDGTTVFLSSHLLAEVEQVCDEVAVLNAGRLVQQGPVGELRTNPARVRVVVSEHDQPLARRLLARWPLRTDGPDTLLVDHVNAREVNEALGCGGVWAIEVSVERVGLEEAFLQLTADAMTVEGAGDAAASR